MKSLGALVCFMLCAVLSEASPHVGVRAQSLGGAYRARASSNDIIYYNPAGLIKNRHFGSDLDYIYEAQARAHGVGISFLDSQSGAWGLGIGYNGRFVEDKKIPNSHLVYLASAMPLVTDMFALGTSIHYMHNRGLGPEPYANFFNIDLGLLANLPMGLSIAFVLDNLLEPKGNEKDLGLALATSFDLGEILPIVPLSFSFDWLMNDVKNKVYLQHQIMTSIQYVIISLVPVRLGYNYDAHTKQKFISMGSGFSTNALALDGLYQQNIKRGEHRYFGVALRWSI